MKATIEAEVRKAIAAVARLPLEALEPDSDIFATLGVDSLGGLEIASFLEERYGLIVREDELQHLRTLSAIVDRVLRDK